jgi:hypothetical protein
MNKVQKSKIYNGLFLETSFASDSNKVIQLFPRKREMKT